ncbi:DUF485 domain-containing protein [Streptomyces cucumeris]|uniref:DUF485 domain-containing protein n=1 Tax=Streptomyces cucumeris TaxID=2962890 RepID=UPI003D737009
MQTAQANDRPGDQRHTGPSYAEVQAGAEFGELRTAHRSFAFPLTVAFVTWYLLYVLLSNYADGFMSTQVVGNVNVALVFGSIIPFQSMVPCRSSHCGNTVVLHRMGAYRTARPARFS